MDTNIKWNGSRFTKTGMWKRRLAVVIVISGIVGVALAARNGGPSPATGELRNDRLTEMQQDGTMQAMLQRHQNMMEQMRASLTPQMQQRMDADPMWKTMRSGEFTQMMEDQQEQIDRMLGRGAP